MCMPSLTQKWKLLTQNIFDSTLTPVDVVADPGAGSGGWNPPPYSVLGNPFFKMAGSGPGNI